MPRKRIGNPELFHNIVQNKNVRDAYAVREKLLKHGFKKGGFQNLVWLATEPIGDGGGNFVGIVVDVPASFPLEQYRQADPIEDEFDVEVYAIPARIINRFPRFASHPSADEIKDETSRDRQRYYRDMDEANLPGDYED